MSNNEWSKELMERIDKFDKACSNQIKKHKFLTQQLEDEVTKIRSRNNTFCETFDTTITNEVQLFVANIASILSNPYLVLKFDDHHTGYKKGYALVDAVMEIPAYVRIILATKQYDEQNAYIDCSPYIYIEGDAAKNIVSVYWCNRSRDGVGFLLDMVDEKELVVQAELGMLDLNLVKKTIEEYLVTELDFLSKDFVVEFEDSLLEMRTLYSHYQYGKELM